MARLCSVFFVLFVVLGIASPASAVPVDGKLDVRARVAREHLRAGGASIDHLRSRGIAVDREGNLDVFIRGSASRAELEAAGARVRTVLPGFCTASIPITALARVEALANVTAIRGGAPCVSELNASIPTTGASQLRASGPGFAGLNGQGVLIGIVDTGIDIDHGDFRDSTGSTRIVSLWDQVEPGTGPPGYPYGKECTSAQINAGTCLYGRDSVGHGTHAAGIAGGDGSQTGNGVPAFTYAGMAPRADLVVVKTDFLTPDVIDGVNYVFDKATARGENAVVNLSLGTQYGSHDGASEFEQGISLLTGPGRIVVKSAGNDRGKALHAQVFATVGGASATLSVSGSTAGKYFSIDGYYNATERLRVRLTTPNGAVIGPLVINTQNAVYPGASTNNGLVYISHDSLSGGRKNVYIDVFQETANKSISGTWTITLLADQLGPANGEVDLWRYLAAPALTANFVTGNLPTQELVTEPGNSSSVITVGAWVTKTSWIGCNGISNSYSGPAVGNLASFSSPGLTRDGRQKPDLVAPGTAIASSTTFDVPQPCPVPATDLLGDNQNHRMLEGTSMAAPHVTGAVALLFQKFGALTPAQAGTYLRSHARSDAFTGAVPSKDWGHGKLELGDLVNPVAHVVTPNGGERYNVGASVNLTWTASDPLGSVASIDLHLSRTGSGGPFETIASGIANSGSHSWNVTAPITTGNAAYLKVVAHDTNANLGTDLSDAGFRIANTVGVEDATPLEFGISRASPNPVSGALDVEFSLAREAPVQLALRDVQGRTVAVLARGVLRAGTHHATWQSRGRFTVPAGVYFLAYDTPEGRIVRRIAVTR